MKKKITFLLFYNELLYSFLYQAIKNKYFLNIFK